MDWASTFIIYLLIFRLAIIATGAISIILGYRLFCVGVWPRTPRTKGTIVEAKLASAGLTLKNAAPGTCFALFGVIIIAVMFMTGGPEMTLQTITRSGLLKDGGSEDLATISESNFKARGAQNGNELIESLGAATTHGIDYQRQKDTTNAVRSYEAAVAMMATPMNHLAWLYQAQGRLEEALPLSQMAVKLVPNDPNFLDTLAEILYRQGERGEALRLLRKAAKLDARLQDKLKIREQQQ